MRDDVTDSALEMTSIGGNCQKEVCTRLCIHQFECRLQLTITPKILHHVDKDHLFNQLANFFSILGLSNISAHTKVPNIIIHCLNHCIEIDVHIQGIIFVKNYRRTS